MAFPGHISYFVRQVRSRLKKDPRRTKTRLALLNAFIVVLLSKPYEKITVDDILRRAEVSRSTFYEHFEGKNALLAASLGHVFGPLADAVRPNGATSRFTAVLEHFWTNRAVARGLLNGPMRARTVNVLAGIVRQRLADGPALIVPRPLAAAQIADAILSPVRGWLLGEAHCSAARLASALQATTIALIDALRASSV